jgi:hypothetical protein
MLLVTLLDIIHIVLLLYPLYMFLIPIMYNKYIFKFILLGTILTPIGWGIFGECIISKVATSINNDENTFTRRRLRIIYEPIMKLFNLNWDNNKDLNKIVNAHIGINLLLMWFYLFFIVKCKIV